MAISTKFRSNDSEIMDDFDLEGNKIKDALDKIVKINQLLGGNRLTLQSVKKIIQNLDKKTPITILDIGCGNGDMLRVLAKYGYKNNFNFKLIGVDANLHTIDYAEKLSTDYYNIEYFSMNIFEEQFVELKYDIVLCTLTLHHFNNDKILELLKILYQNSKLAIVINDLHRSKIAYFLFQMISIIFNLNKMTKHDGLVSILRGFKKSELIDFSEKMKFQIYKIQWKWAFRYQWIIQK